MNHHLADALSAKEMSCLPTHSRFQAKFIIHWNRRPTAEWMKKNEKKPFKGGNNNFLLFFSPLPTFWVFPFIWERTHHSRGPARVGRADTSDEDESEKRNKEDSDAINVIIMQWTFRGASKQWSEYHDFESNLLRARKWTKWIFRCSGEENLVEHEDSTETRRVFYIHSQWSNGFPIRWVGMMKNSHCNVSEREWKTCKLTRSFTFQLRGSLCSIIVRWREEKTQIINDLFNALLLPIFAFAGLSNYWRQLLVRVTQAKQWLFGRNTRPFRRANISLHSSQKNKIASSSQSLLFLSV